MAEEIYMTKEEYASDEQGVVKDAKFAYQAGEAAASKLAENSFYLDGKGPTWYASKDTLDSVQISANNAQEAANNAQSAANNAQTSATLAQTMAMDKVSKSDVVQNTGISETLIMSQKSVSDILSKIQSNATDTYVPKNNIVQDMGTDMYKIMSQKAVTDALSKKYCSIRCNHNTTLTKDAYLPIPWGDEFSENVGNFRRDKYGYIIVPENGIYFATMEGYIRLPNKSTTNNIVTYLDSALQAGETEYYDGRCLQEFLPINSVDFFFHNTAVFTMKAGSIIQSYYYVKVDGAVLQCKSISGKIFVMKIA